MKSPWAFILLTRPVNLLIIAFTMYAMRFGVLASLLKRFSFHGGFELSEAHFALSVLVMILLAAAGNMINDYFDLKVDRLNKPTKVIVGRTVKRRVVMAAHHLFNLAAVAIAAYLGYVNNLEWVVFVPVLMAALLWSYSLWFKRKLWIGNFVVALLVAVVPLWSAVFEIPELRGAMLRLGADGVDFSTEAWRWMAGFAGFAFWTTLIREVQKDLEDQKGDAHAGFLTLPIVWGRKGAHRYLHLLFGILLVAFLVTVWDVRKGLSEPTMQLVFPIISVLAIGLPAGISWFHTVSARTRADYGRASQWSKITMAGGILLGAVMPFWFS